MIRVIVAVLLLCSGGWAMAEDLTKATFAGGCFWCMEGPFEKIDGVKSVISGYAGGDEKDPSYQDVAYGLTGHTEAVQVTYDPAKVPFAKLLDVFWKSHDPTDTSGQFADRGKQYRPSIFYHDDEQKAQAETSKANLEEHGPFKDPILTPIVAFKSFYPAEEYHQDYYKKNPAHYNAYRRGSGRAGFLEQHWGHE